MQDDLQRAYQAYQQALYYLHNPKVCRPSLLFQTQLLTPLFPGRPQALVWYRHSIRPIRFLGSCRGGLLFCPSDGQRFVHLLLRIDNI